MSPDREALLRAFVVYMEQNPEVRFGQALFNLGINQFADTKFPEKANFNLRDIYTDTDTRIYNRLILR